MATQKDEYRKARKRLQARVRSLKKRDYIVPETLIPNIPKKVTQGSIRRLENINKNIYKKVQYITDGNIISGVKGREHERKHRKLRDNFIGIVQTLRDRIRDIKPQTIRINVEHQKNILLEILEDNITYNQMLGSYNDYVRYLKMNEEAIYDSIEVITYESEQSQIIASFSRLATIINETPLDLSVLADISDFTESISYNEE